MNKRQEGRSNPVFVALTVAACVSSRFRTTLEHQNPFAGIKWHEQAVYESLAKPPNKWDHETTFHNILEKLNPHQVQGSAWDPDSIMEYEFEPGLIDEPDQYDTNGLTPPGTLSPMDKQWVSKWYPAMPKSLSLLHAFKPVYL